MVVYPIAVSMGFHHHICTMTQRLKLKLLGMISGWQLLDSCTTSTPGKLHKQMFVTVFDSLFRVEHYLPGKATHHDGDAMLSWIKHTLLPGGRSGRVIQISMYLSECEQVYH